MDAATEEIDATPLETEEADASAPLPAREDTVDPVPLGQGQRKQVCGSGGGLQQPSKHTHPRHAVHRPF